jgi:hypothetical protein
MQYIGRDPVPGDFASSFNKGLQQLVGMKLNKLQQRHEMGNVSKAFQALGIPAEKAEAFATLPQHLQTEFIRSGLLSSLTSPAEQMQNTGTRSNLEQSVMGPEQMYEQRQAQQQGPQQIPQQLAEQGLPDFSQNATIQRALSGGLTPEKQQELALLNEAVQRQAQEPKRPNTIKFNPAEAEAPKATRLAGVSKRVAAENLPENQPLLQTAKERAEKIKEQRATAKEDRAEQHRINKEVRPAYKEIVNEYKGVENDDRRLNRMEELVNKGDLTRPRWHSILNAIDHGIFGAGINLHSLETADSQEFDKLSKEFLKNAKNIFGSRITDNDVKVFMRMVPDLSQSREGKLAIIHNMKLYNEGIRIRKKASDEVLRQNGGQLPYDYEEKVDQLAKPGLDALAVRFQKEVRTQPEPQQSNFLGLPAPELSNPLDILFGRG